MNALVPISMFSVILCGLRIGGVKHIAFQAVAHLWVGGMCVAFWMTRNGTSDMDIALENMVYFGNIVVLSVVEVGCFIADKIRGKASP